MTDFMGFSQGWAHRSLLLAENITEGCFQAPQAGEIISFNIEDGTAVEYKEVLVEIAPFFGGHIIGDRKYA